MTKQAIKEFVEKFIDGQEPDTFIKNKHGRYFYRSENLQSGLDLQLFFEDLLEDFADENNL